VAIDPFQADVARIALTVAADHGFALAGGNSLVAQGIVERPTGDIDLFSPEQEAVAPRLTYPGRPHGRPLTRSFGGGRGLVASAM
jgi:hypothetical protein